MLYGVAKTGDAANRMIERARQGGLYAVVTSERPCAAHDKLMRWLADKANKGKQVPKAMLCNGSTPCDGSHVHVHRQRRRERITTRGIMAERYEGL